MFNQLISVLALSSSYILAVRLADFWTARKQVGFLFRSILVTSYSYVIFQLFPAAGPINWRCVLRGLWMSSPLTVTLLVAHYFVYQCQRYRAPVPYHHLLAMSHWFQVLIGPCAEEICFRHAMLVTGAVTKTSVAWRSFIFALAHAHRLVWSSFRDRELIGAVLFQCSFTFVFACVASYLYISCLHWSNAATALVVCCILHVLCNLLGFPDLERLSMPHWMALLLVFVLCCLSSSL